MAQRVHVVLEDDLDGNSADETVVFGLDGANYEIDLSAKNAGQLRDALAKYVAAARRTTSRGRKASRSRSGDTNAAEMRAWARANGHKVSERGRVPSAVRAAYDAAN